MLASLWDGVRSLVERSVYILGLISGMSILLFGLILFYEVVCRYCFNAPTLWAVETATYMFMFSMFCGLAYTLQAGKHVAIDLFVSRLSVSAARRLYRVMALVGLVFCLVVVFQSYEMTLSALEYHKLSPTPLGFPLWIPNAAMCVGFLFLTLQYAVFWIDSFLPGGEARWNEGGETIE
ncbi:MAG: TRAP transporter small permease [Synergistales bacterium]|nr:TRAP transporter small permease [Synergistales bacterium]